MNSSTNFPHLQLPRRRFVKLLLALLAFLGSCRGKKESQNKTSESTANKLLLGNLQSFSLGVTALELYRIAVICEEQSGVRQFAARSLVCTHQTCLLTHNAFSEAAYRCPCHGSLFDSAGQVLQGPAVKPLPSYRLSVEVHGSGKQLAVHLDETVLADWRLRVEA